MPITSIEVEISETAVTEGCPHFAVEMLDEWKVSILVGENGVELFNVFSVHFSSRVLFFLLYSKSAFCQAEQQ
jgi:hypothetical protein